MGRATVHIFRAAGHKKRTDIGDNEIKEEACSGLEEKIGEVKAGSVWAKTKIVEGQSERYEWPIKSGAFGLHPVAPEVFEQAHPVAFKNMLEVGDMEKVIGQEVTVYDSNVTDPVEGQDQGQSQDI